MSWLFDDEDLEARGNRQYTNGEITVFWQPGKCIHAAYCYRELIEVFNPRRRPWVNMHGAPTEKIIEVVNKCPTDALTWRWNDNEKNKSNPAYKIKQAIKHEQALLRDDTVFIHVAKDGPLVVKGTYDLIGANGEKIQVQPVTAFCRCGASRKQPFCDGSHTKTGFKDENS